MRRFLIGVAALVLAACGGASDSGPSTVSWANGTWIAVRANGLALPFRDAQTFPYVRSDSLTLFIFDPPLSVQGAVFPYQTLVFSAATTPTPIVCFDDNVLVTVTSTGLTTSARSGTTTGGGCNSSFVRLTLTRKGDSLAGTWNGADVRLVRRP